MRLGHKCLCPISALTDRGGRLGQRTREGSERGLSVRQDPPLSAEPEGSKYLIQRSDQPAGRAAAASIPPRGDPSAASRPTPSFDLTCLSWTAEFFPAGGEKVRDHRVKWGTSPAFVAGAPHRFLSPFYVCVSEEVPAPPHSHFLRFPQHRLIFLFPLLVLTRTCLSSRVSLGIILWPGRWVLGRLAHLQILCLGSAVKA